MKKFGKSGGGKGGLHKIKGGKGGTLLVTPSNMSKMGKAGK